MDSPRYDTRFKKRKIIDLSYIDSEDDSDDSDYSDTEDITESENESVSEYDTDDEEIKNIIHFQSEDEWMESLTQKIMKQAQNILDDKQQDKQNPLNKQFIEICNKTNSTTESFEEDFNYFKQLSDENKQNYIHKMKLLHQESNQIPQRFQILNSPVNESIKSIVIRNIDKLNMMEHANGEYHKLKNWIDGVLQIPFGKYIELPVHKQSELSDKQTFLKRANEQLINAIYGHDQAKSYILQILCKWIQNPKSQGNILALQGPMGNGKTTLVKQGIAKALNRPFEFISLGGASDSSLFQGHSYTYEGSIWGKLVDILMKCKCMNPIIYFDELDKISYTNKGDEIVHFLTHITDLSQNSVYQDNYFPGITIDLSKVLFIFSFNDESKIDKILKDRMHVIRTKGFKLDDKLIICKTYLLPEIYSIYNLSRNDIIFTDEILSLIIKEYTNKEDGVRNLKRCLDLIVSKVNMYQILYDTSNKKCYIDLSYQLKDFSIPYTIKKNDIPELLTSLKKNDDPPEHMYL